MSLLELPKAQEQHRRELWAPYKLRYCYSSVKSSRLKACNLGKQIINSVLSTSGIIKFQKKLFRNQSPRSETIFGWNNSSSFTSMVLRKKFRVYRNSLKSKRKSIIKSTRYLSFNQECESVRSREKVAKKVNQTSIRKGEAIDPIKVADFLYLAESGITSQPSFYLTVKSLTLLSHTNQKAAFNNCIRRRIRRATIRVITILS